MKKLWIYFIAVCAAVLTVACEKTDADGYAAGEGGVVMSLANTRAVDMTGKTLDDCTIYIYQKGTDAETSEPSSTLIRKYKPGNCPATIKLLAGNYSVKVQWGKRPAAASFDDCFYEGTADFTIEPGNTKEVAVSCYPQSTVVEVVYDASITDKLKACSAKVALPDDTKPENALIFPESGTGYFTMPEGVTSLDWTFTAEHPKKGPVDKSSTIPDVKPGYKYTLTFKYSPDQPGYISIGIIVDWMTDDHDDVCVFSQDPAVDLKEQQDYTSATLPDEGITVTMKATADDATVKEAHIYSDGGYTASTAAIASTRAGKEPIWTWADGKASDETIATASLSIDKKTLTVKLLKQNFLVQGSTDKLEAGKKSYRFEVVDSNESKADKSMTVRIEGICPATPSDYNLWTNEITLKIISFSGVPTTCKIKQEGSTNEWVSTRVEPTVEKEYKVTFAPEWDELDPNNSEREPDAYLDPKTYKNKAGITVYRPKDGCGIFANHSYTASATIGEKTFDTSFTTTVGQPIPNGDMSVSNADDPLSCFTTNNRYAEFWGSGNNDYAKELCASDTQGERSCAHLKSTMAGAFGFNLLASGNLFTGTFYRPGGNGTVSFGQHYTWKARPTKLCLKYHATIGTVNQQEHKKTDESGNKKHPLNKGDQDKGIIYVAIVDWSARHEVTSGTSAPTGMWSPDEKVNPGEGRIIGYGIFEIAASTTTGDDFWSQLDIPIYYYNTETKPTGAYTLVISCATNIYGDYMCGCDSNELWVTDFEWGY